MDDNTDWILMYRVGIEMLENKELSGQPGDEFDLMGVLLNRTTILEEMQLTTKQEEELQELDERLRAVLLPTLQRIKCLEWYKAQFSHMPKEEWWWHVDEKMKAEKLKKEQ